VSDRTSAYSIRRRNSLPVALDALNSIKDAAITDSSIYNAGPIGTADGSARVVPSRTHVVLLDMLRCESGLTLILSDNIVQRNDHSTPDPY
jgi:hypothetical protein